MQLGVFKSGSVCIAAMGAQWSVLRSFKSFLGKGPRSIYSCFICFIKLLFLLHLGFKFCMKQLYSADAVVFLEFLYNYIVCNSTVQQHSQVRSHRYKVLSDGVPITVRWLFYISPIQQSFGTLGQAKVIGDRQRETSQEICCSEL